MRRFARVLVDGAPHFAHVQGEELVLWAGAPWDAAAMPTSRRVAMSEAVWLPVTPASKVVAVGQNYRKHAAEMGKPVPAEPLLFLKPSTALNAHQSPIVLPPESAEVHHESELGLVIGRRLSRATEAEAALGIFALTCFNDVTARDIQRREVQHTRGKGFDTFACAGPFLVEGLESDDLRVACYVNGELRQEGRTSDMVFSPAKLVSFMSHAMTLLPGDLIATGTPSGVGPLRHGDCVEVDIEGVGRLSNPVVAG